MSGKHLKFISVVCHDAVVSSPSLEGVVRCGGRNRKADKCYNSEDFMGDTTTPL